MKNKAIIALVALSCLFFVTACKRLEGIGRSQIPEGVEPHYRPKPAQKKEEANIKSAPAEQTKTAEPAKKTRQLTADQAYRVAAEIVASAALLRDVSHVSNCVYGAVAWSDTVPAVAETGLGLPIVHWECAEERVSLNDAKRALAALLARHSIDVMRGQRGAPDEMTVQDVNTMLCEIGQIMYPKSNYRACLDRLAKSSPDKQERTLVMEAQQCAEAVVTANVAAIETAATRFSRKFEVDGSGRFLDSLIGYEDFEEFVTNVGIIPMRGDVTDDLPDFCRASKPIPDTTYAKSSDTKVAPEYQVVRNVFLRLSSEIVTRSLLQRNPDSNCTAWSLSDETGMRFNSSITQGTFLIDYANGWAADENDGCITTYFAENATQQEFFGDSLTGERTDESYMTARFAERDMYSRWRSKMFTASFEDGPERLRQLWSNRDIARSVHFPAYRTHVSMQRWQNSACAREVVKVNKALIADYATALHARLMLKARSYGRDDKYFLEARLSAAEALALMPHQPFFPSKRKVPAFCAAPEPKKAKTGAKTK